MTESIYFSSTALENLVRKKYPGPAFIVLTEVRDSTGFEGTGKEADALAFGVWPSRGLQVIGFEFKSQRNDWLRELKDPAKAETIASRCDEWWLVAADGVAKLEEIPLGWGWYIPTEKGLKVGKPAPAMMEPRSIGRPFLMSIVRNIARNYIPANKVKEEAERRAEDLVKERHHRDSWQIEEGKRFSKILDDFKEATGGVDLRSSYSFDPKEVGAIVKAINTDGLRHDLKSVKQAADHVAKALEELGKTELFKEVLKT